MNKITTQCVSQEVNEVGRPTLCCKTNPGYYFSPPGPINFPLSGAGGWTSHPELTTLQTTSAVEFKENSTEWIFITAMKVEWKSNAQWLPTQLCSGLTEKTRRSIKYKQNHNSFLSLALSTAHTLLLLPQKVSSLRAGLGASLLDARVTVGLAPSERSANTG